MGGGLEPVTGIGGMSSGRRIPKTWPSGTPDTSGSIQHGRLMRRRLEQRPADRLPGMSADSEHSGSSDRRWSINFRVSDLDAMVRQLRAGGFEVDVDTQNCPHGRFARLERS